MASFWPLYGIFCCFALIPFQFVFAAQNTGKITVGQSLTAATNGGLSWVSSSGDFAFGFHQLNDSLFLLAIWYAKIPDTVVWYANDGYPVPQGSTVRLTADQGLILADHQGNTLWNTSDVTANVSYGLMNDTGNFVLKSNSNDVVWETFKHPTDTLLPTQSMDRGGEITSRRSKTNFTRGRFQLRLLYDGNLVVNTREPESNYANAPYYQSSTTDVKNQTNAGQQLVYDESGHMYLLRSDGSTTMDLLPHPVSARDYYQRATMDYDGMLTWYYHPRSSSGVWTPYKMLPGGNICDQVPDVPGYARYADSGICGYNGICSLTNEGRPTCQCPANYSLVDPSDTFGSCKPDFIMDQCGGDVTAKNEYFLVPLRGTHFPFGDYAKLMNVTEDECKNDCLNDCFCSAVIFDGNVKCWKKKHPLSYGARITLATTTWIKVGKLSTMPTNPFPNNTPKGKTRLQTVLSVLLGTSVFANVFLTSVIGFGVLLMNRNKRIKQLCRGQCNSPFREYSNITCFSFQELTEATNEFKEELGRGAFGRVYKGIIGTGNLQRLVAVKKLDRISNGTDKEYETEVNVIGQTHHKNLVQLIGFCKEQDQRLLVYEYMSNGTLAGYLFCDQKPSWEARVEIIHGVAKGLLYLHEECRTQIIHCDIKPQNILLDDCHKARISDFGLAKLLVINQSQTNTGIRGTRGYVAPEWFRNKPVTVKVDVYSFGVLLLEIICCRRSVCLDAEAEEKVILTEWAFDCYQSGTLDDLVSDDTGALNDRQHLERFVMVALWCIQDDPSLRPTMAVVTHMLQGVIQVPRPPFPASFSITTQM